MTDTKTRREVVMDKIDKYVREHYKPTCEIIGSIYLLTLAMYLVFAPFYYGIRALYNWLY